jgi:hypothetical protein
VADREFVFKQVVAVVDKRTTTICLHAAGQIRSILEPFETLNGQYDMPPFHIHCRSISVPWMPGFVNEQRAQANAELKERPMNQRRIGPGGQLAIKLPPAPLPTDSVGIPVVIPPDPDVDDS